MQVGSGHQVSIVKSGLLGDSQATSSKMPMPTATSAATPPKYRSAQDFFPEDLKQDFPQIHAEFLRSLGSIADPSLFVAETIRMASNTLGGGLTSGEGQDGYYRLQTYLIAKQILTLYFRSHPQIPANTKQELTDFIDKVIASERSILHLVGEGRQLNHLELIRAEAMRQAQCVNDLKENTPNDTFLFSGGWATASGGHAQIYQFKKTAPDLFEVIIYTSTYYPSVEYVHMGYGKTLLKPTLIFKDVPASIILHKDPEGNIASGMFLHLLQLRATKPSDQIPLNNEEVADIFEPMRKFKVSPKQLEDCGAETGQRAGTCVPSVMKAAFRHICKKGALYKNLIFFYKNILLLLVYENLKNVIEECTPRGADARFLLMACSVNQGLRCVKEITGNFAKVSLEEVRHATTVAEAIKEIVGRAEARVLERMTQEEIPTTVINFSDEVQRRKRAAEIAKQFPTPSYCGDLKVTPVLTKVMVPCISAKDFFANFGKYQEKSQDRDYVNGIFVAADMLQQFIDSIPLPQYVGESVSASSGSQVAKFRHFFDELSESQLREVQTDLLSILQTYSDFFNRKHSLKYEETESRKYATLFPLYVLSHYVLLKLDGIRRQNRKSTHHVSLEDYHLPGFESYLLQPRSFFLDAHEFARVCDAHQYLSHFKEDGKKLSVFFWGGSKTSHPVTLDGGIVGNPGNTALWEALLSSDQELRTGVLTLESIFPDTLESKSLSDRQKRLILMEIDTNQSISVKTQAYGYMGTFRTMAFWMHHLLEGKSISFAVLGHLRSNELWYRYAEVGKIIPQNFLPPINPAFSTQLEKHPAFLRERTMPPKGVQEEAATLLSSIDHPIPGLLSPSLHPLFKRLCRSAYEWRLAPFQIFSELVKEPQKLKNPEIQFIVFSLLFNSPVLKEGDNNVLELGLGELIATDEATEKRANTFIQESLAKLIHDSSAMEASQFIFELSYYLCRFLKQQKKNGSSFNLLKLIDAEWISKKTLSAADIRVLHLYRILFFSLRRFNPSDSLPVFKSWFLYHQQIDGIRNPVVQKYAVQYIMAFTEYLRSTLKEQEPFCSQLGNHILLELGLVKEGNFSWCVQGLPNPSEESSLIATTCESWKLNLYTGEICGPLGKVVMASKESPWEKQEDFMKLFSGKVSFSYRYEGEHIVYFSHPTKGEFRLVNMGGVYVINKKIDGEWYFLADPQRLEKSFPVPLRQDHRVWLRKEGGFNIGDSLICGVVTTLSDHRIVALLKDNGEIVEADPDSLKPALRVDGSHYDYLDVARDDQGAVIEQYEEQIKQLERFDVRQNILVERREGRIQSLSFPRYTFVNGAKLSFECIEGDYCLSINRDFILPQKMRPYLLGTVHNYLHLKTADGREKLIVPFQYIERKGGMHPEGTLAIRNGTPMISGTDREFHATQHCFEFDVRNGCVRPVRTDQEGHLFLAYILFSQMKYGEAIELLQSCPSITRLSSIGMKILELIQDLPVGVDHPDATMVKLHALWVYIRRKEEKSIERIEKYFDDPSLGLKLLQYYSPALLKLLQTRANVSEKCQMPEKRLLDLIRKLLNEFSQLQSLAKFDPVMVGNYSYLEEKLKILSDQAQSDSMVRKYSVPLIQSTQMQDVQLLSEPDLKVPVFRQEASMSYEIAQANLAYSLKEYKRKLEDGTGWLRRGLQVPMDGSELSYIDGDRYLSEKNGAFFLYVYKIAKTGTGAEKSQLKDLIRTWERRGERRLVSRSNDVYFSYVKSLLYNGGEGFPDLSLICPDSTDEELYKFLGNVQRAFKKNLTSQSSWMPERVRDDPVALFLRGDQQSDPYPISASPKLKKAMVELGSLRTIPYKIPDDKARWSKFDEWKQKVERNEFAGLLELVGRELWEQSGRRDVLERQLLMLANQPCQNEVDKLLEKAKWVGNMRSDFSFDDCIQALQSDDIRNYRKRNPHLDDEMISQIASMTLEILSGDSFIAQLHRLQKLLEMNPEGNRGVIQQIVAILDNGYRFDGLSPVEGAVLRIFAARGGKIPFSSQMDLFRKVIHLESTHLECKEDASPPPVGGVKDAVVHATMGAGKTVFMGQTVLEIHSRSIGSLSVFLSTAALIQAAKLVLNTGSVQAFNKSLSSLEMQRSEFTTFGLRRALRVCQKAVENRRPMTICTSTLKGFGLERLSLWLKLADIIGKGKGDLDLQLIGEEEGVLWEKCHLLNELLSIPKDGIIDEVDSVLNYRQATIYVDKVQQDIDPNIIILMMTIYKCLVASHLKVRILGKPEQTLENFIQLRSNKQDTTMQSAEFCPYVAPVVARELLAGTLFAFEPFKAIPDEHHNSLVRYVSGQISSEQYERISQGKGEREKLLATYSREDVENILFFRYLDSLYFERHNVVLARLITTTYQILSSILPYALSQTQNRNYGPAKDSELPAGQLGKVKPYVAVSKESSADFGNFLVNIAFCFQNCLQVKPTREMFWHLATPLYHKAEAYSRNMGQEIANSPQFDYFKALCGVSLQDVFYKQEAATDQAIDALFAQPIHLLQVQCETVKRVVQCNEECLTSNGFDLLQHLRSRIGMTGTPSEYQGWPKSMVEHFKPDESIDTKLEDALLRRVAPQNIRSANDLSSVRAFLTDIHAQYCSTQEGRARFRRIRMWLDPAGMCKIFSSHRNVAREWIRFIIDIQTVEAKADIPLDQRTVDPNIEAVLFFDDEDGDQLCAYKKMQKGKLERVPLGVATAAELRERGLTPDKYVIYDDEAHTTGTDFETLRDAIGLQTAPQRIRDTKQSMMRLRKYLDESGDVRQEVDFVIDPSARARLPNGGKTISDLVNYGKQVQEGERQKGIVESFKHYIDSTRKAIVVNAIEKMFFPNKKFDGEKRQEFCIWITKLKGFFVDKMEKDPFLAYRTIPKRGDTAQLLLSRLQTTVVAFQEVYKQLPGYNEAFLEEVGATFDELKKWILHVDLQGWFPKTSLDSTFSVDLLVEQELAVKKTTSKQVAALPASSCELVVEQEVKMDVDIDVKQEVAVQQDLLKELQQYRQDFCRVNLAYEKDMTKITFEGLITSLRQGIQTDAYKPLTKQLEEYKRYKRSYHLLFDAPIYGTDAYFYADKSREPQSVFYLFARPAKQILVVKMSSGTYQWLLLSVHEAACAKQILSGLRKDGARSCKDVWLIDNNGQELVTEIPGNELDLDDFIVQADLLQINGFLGDIHYLSQGANRDAFIEWLDNPPDKLEDKIHFLELRTCEDEEQRRVFLGNFLINERMGNSTRMPQLEGFVCEDPELYEVQRQKIDQSNKEQLTPAKIKCLTAQRLIEKLDPSLVPYLCIDWSKRDTDPATKEAIADLWEGDETEEKIAEHNKHQLKFISQIHAEALLPWQVQWVSYEYMPYLNKPEQMQYLNANHILGLVQAQIPLLKHIPRSLYKHFSKSWQIVSLSKKDLQYIDPLLYDSIAPEMRASLTKQDVLDPDCVLICRAALALDSSSGNAAVGFAGRRLVAARQVAIDNGTAPPPSNGFAKIWNELSVEEVCRVPLALLQFLTWDQLKHYVKCASNGEFTPKLMPFLANNHLQTLYEEIGQIDVSKWNELVSGLTPERIKVLSGRCTELFKVLPLNKLRYLIADQKREFRNSQRLDSLTREEFLDPENAPLMSLTHDEPQVQRYFDSLSQEEIRDKLSPELIRYLPFGKLPPITSRLVPYLSQDHLGCLYKSDEATWMDMREHFTQTQVNTFTPEMCRKMHRQHLKYLNKQQLRYVPEELGTHLPLDKVRLMTTYQEFQVLAGNTVQLLSRAQVDKMLDQDFVFLVQKFPEWISREMLQNQYLSNGKLWVYSNQPGVKEQWTRWAEAPENQGKLPFHKSQIASFNTKALVDLIPTSRYQHCLQRHHVKFLRPEQLDACPQELRPVRRAKSMQMKHRAEEDEAKGDHWSAWGAGAQPMQVVSKPPAASPAVAKPPVAAPAPAVAKPPVAAPSVAAPAPSVAAPAPAVAKPPEPAIKADPNTPKSPRLPPMNPNPSGSIIWKISQVAILCFAACVVIYGVFRGYHLMKNKELTKTLQNIFMRSNPNRYI